MSANSELVSDKGVRITQDLLSELMRLTQSISSTDEQRTSKHVAATMPEDSPVDIRVAVLKKQQDRY